MMDDDQLSESKIAMPLMVQALVDGELDPTTARRIENLIAADPAFAAQRDSLLALKAAIKRVPQPEINSALRMKIAGIGSPVQPANTATLLPFSARLASRSYDWRALAASIAVTAVLASGVTRLLNLNSSPDSFTMAIADDHRRSLLAASPFDVASSDRHTVKPWLDAKLGVSPPAPDLAAQGFSLAGGRVEVVSDKPIPTLVYRHHEHLISLVAEPRHDGSVSEPIDQSVAGFSVVKWSDGAFAYWAISDTEWPDLNDFVAQFRAAANPK
jgi:anti-sigma factor RsiW